MIPCVRDKEGVEYAIISPAGHHIQWAIRSAALTLGHDIEVTAGTNGAHSGPDDPHYKGDAYDLHTKDVPDKQLMLDTIMGSLGTVKFYGFIEDPDSDNEHVHVQLRHGILYP